MLFRILLPLTLLIASSVNSFSDISFWNTTKKGANCFNRKVTEEYFIAAQELGLDYIRLVPDKWEGEERDFLIGSCDEFTAINESDFQELLRILDLAHKYDQKIVLGMLSLPGCRWGQLNNDKIDYRLWQEPGYQEQAVAFWVELASRLKDHPAIVAFNPLNEPHPALGDGIEDLLGDTFADWLKKHEGSSRDLNLFNRRMVEAIRNVDSDTPILIEGYGYGGREGLSFVTPIEDKNILYSFHFYEPYNYTSSRANKGKYSYPDKMPEWWNSPPVTWTKDTLRLRLQTVSNWSSKNNIPKNRIVAAEFGCGRLNKGATQYLTDLVDLLNEFNWHWAFYSFREDTWQAMDYELGTLPTNGSFWKAVENGEASKLYQTDDPLWSIFKSQFTSYNNSLNATTSPNQ